VEPFRRLTAVAAPLDVPDVDTDQIVPARFLSRPRGPEYARYLFHDLRFTPAGEERPEFVLNRPAYRGARILVTAENFGCGSSREMAVWALRAYGIRAVIAPSLGDIFRANCVRNGVVPVVLPREIVAALRAQLHATPGAPVTVDLESETVTGPDGAVHRFGIDPFHRHLLLRGEDELALTLSYAAAIEAFEQRLAREQAWVLPGAAGPPAAGSTAPDAQGQPT
jgi:3-isopropylmalate/(R)-2-methylmalate dehydratase small subunit